MSKLTYGVFIGRFQPLHSGHEHVIREALKQVDKLIVLVGSANQARDVRNPFTFEERKAMIRGLFGAEMIREDLIVEPLPDSPYSETAWIAHVQQIVARLIERRYNFGRTDHDIKLAGYGKDASSYYLKLFPEWGSIQIDSQFGTFSSTDVRNSYFRRIPRIEKSILSANTVRLLEDFKMSGEFKELLAEKEYLDDYPKQWGKGPFVTADAVVIQSGHILLVRRGGLPGRGLLALPGGFVDPGERIFDAAVRELREETQISDSKGEIPPAMLASFIDQSSTRVFDAPNRSLRGRIITHAHLFKLPARKELFTVTGGDDAAHASWYPLGELKPEQFFEDHWSIIEMMADL